MLKAIIRWNGRRVKKQLQEQYNRIETKRKECEMRGDYTESGELWNKQKEIIQRIFYLNRDVISLK